MSAVVAVHCRLFPSRRMANFIHRSNYSYSSTSLSFFHQEQTRKKQAKKVEREHRGKVNMSNNSYAPDHNATASTATPSNNTSNNDDPRQVRLSCPVCSTKAGYFSSAGLAVHDRLVHVLKLKILRPPDKNGHSTVQTIYRMDGVFGCPGCDLFYHMDPFLVLTHAINAHGYRYPAPPTNSEQSPFASTSSLSVSQKPPPPPPPPPPPAAAQVNQNMSGSEAGDSRSSSRAEMSAPMRVSAPYTDGRKSPLDLHHHHQQRQYNHYQQQQQNQLYSQQNQNYSLQNSPVNSFPIPHLAPPATASVQVNRNPSILPLVYPSNSTEVITSNPNLVSWQEGRREASPMNPAASYASPVLSDHRIVPSQSRPAMTASAPQPHRPEFNTGWRYNSHTGQPLQSTPQHTTLSTQMNPNTLNTDTSKTMSTLGNAPHSTSTAPHQLSTSKWPAQQQQQQQQSVNSPFIIQSPYQAQPSDRVSSNIDPSACRPSDVPPCEECISSQSRPHSDTNNNTDRAGSSIALRPPLHSQTTISHQPQMPNTPLPQRSPSLEEGGSSTKQGQAIYPSATGEQRHALAPSTDHLNNILASPVRPTLNRPNSTMANASAIRSQNEEENRSQAPARHVLPPKPTLPPSGNASKTSSSSSYSINMVPAPSGNPPNLIQMAISRPVVRPNEIQGNNIMRKQERGPLASELRPVHLPAKLQTEAPNGTNNRFSRALGQASLGVLGKRGREDENPATFPIGSRQRVSQSQRENSTDPRQITTPATHGFPSKPISNPVSYPAFPLRPPSAPLPDDSVSHQLQSQQTDSTDQTPSISLVFIALTHVLPVFYNDTHLPLHLLKHVPRLISLLRAYHYLLIDQIQEAILAEARGEMPEGWSQKERKKLWSLKEKCKIDSRFKRAGEHEIMFKYWHQMTSMLLQPHQVSAITNQMNAYFPRHLENSKTRPVRHVLEQMLKQVVQFVQTYEGPPENLFLELHRAKITVPTSSINKHPATLTFPLWIENSWAIVHWAQQVHEGWQAMRSLFPDESNKIASHSRSSSSTSTSTSTSLPTSSGISMKETLLRTKRILDDLGMNRFVDKDRVHVRTPTEQEKEDRQGVV